MHDEIYSSIFFVSSGPADLKWRIGVKARGRRFAQQVKAIEYPKKWLRRRLTPVDGVPVHCFPIRIRVKFQRRGHIAVRFKTDLAARIHRQLLQQPAARAINPHMAKKLPIKSAVRSSLRR